MAQRLRVLVALPKGSGPTASTHMAASNVYNSNSRGSCTLTQTNADKTPMHIKLYVHIYKIKRKKNQSVYRQLLPPLII